MIISHSLVSLAAIGRNGPAGKWDNLGLLEDSLATFNLKEYARRGAGHRIIEIRDELSTIFRQFPDLGAPRRATGSPFPPNELAALGGRETTEDAPRRRRRRKMTAAQRKAVSLRMKRYWAQRAKERK